MKKTMNLTAFLLMYLFSTLVLIADIDLSCQRAFPINWALWLVQGLSLGCITTFVALKTNPHLFSDCLVLTLVMTTIYAVFGNIDFEFEKKNGSKNSCFKSYAKLKLAFVLFISVVSVIFTGLISYGKSNLGYSTAIPERVGSP